MLNLDAAQIVLSQGHVAGASAAFGDRGGEALIALFGLVRNVFASRPPELITSPFIAFVPVDPAATDQLISTHGAATMMNAPADVATFISEHVDHSIIVAIAADQTFRAVATKTAIDLETIATTAVAYHRENSIERIVAGPHDNVVPRLATISASNFAEPTFSGLDDALGLYRKTAADCGCQILAGSWAGGRDGPRLVLVNRPEAIMRDSLFQALATILRRAHVTREHTTDATKPVDIHVAWVGSPAEAMIEIKWIGKSEKKPEKGPGLFGFPVSRAQEGADQLADYLDRKKSSSSNSSVRGYLVVYDARRRNVEDPVTPITREDALAFKNAEITYNPDHSNNRSDFAEPMRWFLEPRETHFLETE